MSGKPCAYGPFCMRYVEPGQTICKHHRGEDMNKQPNWTRVFPTQEQAEAFIDGVDFVNDSSIEIIGIEPHEGEGGGWTVLLWDESAELKQKALDNELE